MSASTRSRLPSSVIRRTLRNRPRRRRSSSAVRSASRADRSAAAGAGVPVMSRSRIGGGALGQTLYLVRQPVFPFAGDIPAPGPDQPSGDRRDLAERGERRADLDRGEPAGQGHVRGPTPRAEGVIRIDRVVERVDHPGLQVEQGGGRDRQPGQHEAATAEDQQSADDGRQRRPAASERSRSSTWGPMASVSANVMCGRLDAPVCLPWFGNPASASRCQLPRT